MTVPLYQEYVAAQSRKNSCLINLARFLFQGKKQSIGEGRMYCFEHTGANPKPDGKEVRDLQSLLTEGNANKHLHGRTLIVEDPNREIVENLGTLLDIDPFFLASHISYPFARDEYQQPASATLPSRIWTRSFLNIDYHRVLRFSLWCTSASKETSPWRECTSKGLVLVDAPIPDAFIVEGRSTVPGKEIVMLDQRPFQGGTEEFTDPPSYSNYLRQTPKPKNDSLFDDLACYLQVPAPGFDVSKPSLLSLAYYPLKIATAEWLNYTTLMSHCVKHYECSFQDLRLRLKDTALLDADLCNLQSWRRRGTQTLQKLRAASEFTKYWRSKETKPEAEEWDLMIKDFDYITVKVEAYSRPLEAMVPVVISLVQILDSQRSFAEAVNIKQLIYMALVFVPLSFVATLFSMSDNFIPGGRENG